MTTDSRRPISLPYAASNPTLEELRESAAGCTACDLYQRATATVFGAGAPDARLLLVGEQPGDEEDRAGAPFVGPAGRLLDDALEAAGIDASDVYVTNAVKHFKWEPRGKRRLHKKPSTAEMMACRPWLAWELSVVMPEVVVCLGATATRSVLGPDVQVMRDHGAFLPWDGPSRVLVTLHPSAVLRARDHEAREQAMAMLVGDLREAAGALTDRSDAGRSHGSDRQPTSSS